ncbi:hypothetical protein DLL80_23875 [Salmonella enterica subsp. enterica serovar Newport]|uniref:Uncharacterized protein n=1 Tax=Salmonella newport TaxID=108619 RepID=A0A5V6RMI3_SALNE|nr:hypothetical protein [Salmonella enterica subsp. enterica serovar Newport]
MYFNTDSFDFNSIVDVVESNETPLVKDITTLKEVGPDGGSVSDASDLMSEEELAALEEEKARLADPNQNISDILYNEEEKQQILEDFNYLPDDFVIDWGGKYQGSKAEVLEKLEKIEQVEAKEEFLTALYDNAEQGSRWLNRESGVTKRALNAEINQIIIDLNNAPNKVEKADCYERLIHKQQELENFYKAEDEAIRVQDAIKQQAIEANTLKVNNIMAKRFTDFNEVMAGAYEEMKANGLSRVKFERDNYNPWVAEQVYIAQKTKQRENGKVKLAYENAEKRKAARSASNSAPSQRNTPQDTSAAELAALRRKMSSGGLTREEHAKLFPFLKD